MTDEAKTVDATARIIATAKSHGSGGYPDVTPTGRNVQGVPFAHDDPVADMVAAQRESAKRQAKKHHSGGYPA